MLLVEIGKWIIHENLVKLRDSVMIFFSLFSKLLAIEDFRLYNFGWEREGGHIVCSCDKEAVV